MQLPLIPEIPQERSYLQEFRGLNRHERIGEGEFYDMCNLSNDEYPVLATRKKRRHAEDAYDIVVGMAAFGGHLYVLAADIGSLFVYLYVDGVKSNHFILPLSYGDDEEPTQRQIAVNGMWLLIYPDKVYFDTGQDGTLHFMERTFESSTLTAQRVDDLYQPSANGKLVKILGADNAETDSSLSHFHIYDTVHVSFTYLDGGISRDGDFDAVIYSSGIDIDTKKPYVIIQRADGQTTSVAVDGDVIDGDYMGGSDVPIYTQYILTIKRPVPDLDYFTASGNRIYGVRFSQEDGTTINSIYVSSASDIFDFSINTQGYSAWEGTVGETGAFTGIASLGSSVYAFKRDCAVRVAGSGANISTHVLHVPGVSYGAFRSLAEHEGYLYYKGDAGIYRFNGEYAQLISEAFGDRVYTGGCGAFLGNKYYVSLQRAMTEQDAEELPVFPSRNKSALGWLADFIQWLREYHYATYSAACYPLFVMDTSAGTWTVESVDAFTFMASDINTLYMAENGRAVEAITQGRQDIDLVSAWAEEDDFDWWCQSGTQGYETPDEKHLGRLLVRMRLKPETVVRVMMQYDNETTWETVATIQDAGIRQTVVPIIPRRCDVYRMRIEGHGECRIYGITKTIEGGSDIQWHT